MSLLSPQPPMNRKNRHSQVKSPQSGFALVLVLWVLSLLTIMAGSFALTMRRESTIVAGLKDNAGATAAAEAGIAYAELMLLHPEQIKRWRADGNIYQVNFGDTQVRLRLLSEAGKIDINKANLALLQGLMIQAPVEESQQAKLIGAIIDWRDQDDLVSIDGAEKKQYEDAGLKYHPRNKPFQTLEELQMVLGIDEQVYNWLAPIATVYSGQAQVNLQLASAKVLKLLPNLDAGLIDSYIATRLDTARNDLPLPVFPAGLVSNGLGAGSNAAVTIVSEAILADETSALVTATVLKSGGGSQVELPDAADADGAQSQPYKVLEWQRNPVNEPSLFSEEMNELLVKEYAESELSD